MEKKVNRRLINLISNNHIDSITLSELTSESSTLEKKLIRFFPRFKNTKRIATYQDILASLKPRESTIEFIHYNIINNNEYIYDSIYYGAVILNYLDSVPHFIRLFEERQLRNLLDKVENEGSTTNILYASTDNKFRGGILLDEHISYGNTLYNLIWKPLEPLLKKTKRIYFAPSGLLNNISFSAIPVENNRLLLDCFDLRQVSSSKSIISNSRINIPKNISLALFGGIKYSNEDTQYINIPNENIKHANELTVNYYEQKEDSDFEFNYLPSSLIDVNNITKLFDKSLVKCFTGYDASEKIYTSFVLIP
ncbi:MAG: CHAT domain-containing protein [Saprospiraceae bacterium]|uniref:CHAT domain-containing protein n=1 Tax=Candidatus Defluviibacterium haderslevense TaxID=2981993 RepID=A0A9D7SCQ3_9BACT|nr:CHAT domain-containing protein [Candidatus Defluviibacterium haderslevense]